jgi:hypothetical protein
MSWAIAITFQEILAEADHLRLAPSAHEGTSAYVASRPESRVRAEQPREKGKQWEKRGARAPRPGNVWCEHHKMRTDHDVSGCIDAMVVRAREQRERQEVGEPPKTF